MSKRPPIDLMSLTAEQAVPMAEATQRAPAVAPNTVPMSQPERDKADRPQNQPTQNLDSLSFKVSIDFRKRFRRRAVEANLKLNELLVAALAAWEEQHGMKD